MMAHQQPHPGLVPGMQYGQHIGPPNPGQPPGQGLPPQMMSGVSGPNGPHVSQAGMMAGVQPGVGGGGPGMPNAHALSHLTPQVFHQQQMLNSVNPQQAYLRQQTLIRMQQQAQQQAQQQQHNNAMAMGLPNGMTPSMVPQQMGQFPNIVNLPAHLQQQQHMAQQQQQQQQLQQAQQAQQAQQQQQQQSHSQMQHNQMLAQQMAMQQAASQSSNQGQQGPQAQMRPQQQMPGGQDQQATMIQQQQQQHQQQVQQQAQQAQQHAQQAQQQAQQQGQASQQQGQQGPPQSNPQVPTSQQQLQQLQQQQQQRQQAAQQQLFLRQQAQQQGQTRMGGNMILKLMQFRDHLAQYSAESGNSSMSDLSNFVSEFFSDLGTLRQQLWDSQENRTKQFEVPTAMLARFFATQFNSGVENIQIVIGRAMQSNLPNNCHYVECSKAKFIYSYNNESQLICSGELRAWFGQNDKLDLLEFMINEHKEYISRASIEYLFSPESPNQKLQSPKMTKAMSKQGRQQSRQQAERSIVLSDLPPSCIGYMGVAKEVMSYLEIGETFNLMQDLIFFSQQNPSIPPSDSLQRLADTYSAQSQQGLQPQQQQHPNFAAALPPHMNPANQPPGSRTPSLSHTNNPQFASPAMQNLNLPRGQNSPHIGHTPSPAQGHMQAPGMMAQHSTHGTNSGAASTNTSPNNTNKRRRQSAVKTEGDDAAAGMGEVNAVSGGGAPSKVKASPRVGGKKQKGAGRDGPRLVFRRSISVQH